MLRAIDTVKVATTLAVSVATIKRYLKQRREMEHVLPKSIPVNSYEFFHIFWAYLRFGLILMLY
ncbi:hypothetical protein KSB_12190 [Ktedonobacter robiniae]|uniref:HTH merR-type domain-containing protein n=1 Tax=Ktedonobacter robiniae TaxID=2778365 RepID=A0ABQ3UJ50_9CHLR|nr:hypothetical protein KSB_12190 [Ktedonobacter robiniae]